MIRTEIRELIALGPFPASENVNSETIRRQHELVQGIKPPVTNEEAKELLRVFGPDDYFGAAWTIVHLIESAPGWPIEECLAQVSNEWISRLKARAKPASDRFKGSEDRK